MSECVSVTVSVSGWVGGCMCERERESVSLFLCPCHYVCT